MKAKNIVAATAAVLALVPAAKAASMDQLDAGAYGSRTSFKSDRMTSPTGIYVNGRFVLSSSDSASIALQAKANLETGRLNYGSSSGEDFFGRTFAGDLQGEKRLGNVFGRANVGAEWHTLEGGEGIAFQRSQEARVGARVGYDVADQQIFAGVSTGVGTEERRSIHSGSVYGARFTEEENPIRITEANVGANIQLDLDSIVAFENPFGLSPNAFVIRPVVYLRNKAGQANSYKEVGGSVDATLFAKRLGFQIGADYSRVLNGNRYAAGFPDAQRTWVLRTGFTVRNPSRTD